MPAEYLTSDWKRASLRDCCFRPEYGYTASASAKPVGPKFLRITDIQNGKVEWEKVPYAARPENGSKRYLLETGDIVIARIGATTGKTYLIRQCPEAVFASYLIRVRTKPGLLPEFLNLCLQTAQYWQHIDSEKGGRLKGGVNIPILESLEIPLPIPPEQHAIARALEAVQRAAQARQRELFLEHERKTALMQHLFTHGTRSELTKQTEIGDIPQSWRVARLGETASELRSGITPKGGEKVYLKTGIPLIRSQNVLMNKLSLSDVAFISPDVHDSMMGSAVRPGDVLLNITGASIGRVTFVPDELKVANVNQHVCRIRLAPHANPAFVAYYLSTPPGQAQVLGSQFGTTRQGLNYGNVRAFRIPIPPLEEQREISNVLLACDNKMSVLQKEEAQLGELFRAMLEELMSGWLSAVPLIEEQQTQ
jgi:type I restriction enzyme S subunit